MTLGTWNNIKALVKGAKRITKTNSVPKNVVFGAQCNETEDSPGFTILFSAKRTFAALDTGEIYIIHA
jgi:hypothetical protein